MDGGRFDNLAKATGGDGSRRALIKKLAGALAGVAAIGIPVRAGAKPIGSYCSYDADCDNYGSICKDGTCQCPDGQHAPDGSHCEPIECPYGTSWCAEEQQCINENQCCGGCGYGETCCNGTCIPVDGCCGDYDCGYGEVCEYGACVADAPPTSEGGNEGRNYTKNCKARCRRKCVKSGRKKGKLSGAKLRSACKNRCKRNCR